jgi:hypothetical protein
VPDPAAPVVREFSLPREIAAPVPAPPAIEMPTEDQVQAASSVPFAEADPAPRGVSRVLILAATVLAIAAVAWWQRDLWMPSPDNEAIAVGEVSRAGALPSDDTPTNSTEDSAAAVDDAAPAAMAGDPDEAAPRVGEPQASTPADSLDPGLDSDPPEATPMRASTLVEEDDPAASGGGAGARLVRGLQVDELPQSTLIRVIADRPILPSQIEVVSLAGPPRFVVKIRGIGQLFSTGARGKRISRIRSGVHPGPELHLVLDLDSSSYETTADVVDGELLIGVEDL